MYKGRSGRERGCLRYTYGSKELKVEAAGQGGEALTRGVMTVSCSGGCWEIGGRPRSVLDPGCLSQVCHVHSGMWRL